MEKFSVESFIETPIIGVNDIERLVHEKTQPHEKYFLLEHKVHGVYVGELINGKYNYHDNSGLEVENLLELRVFNKNMEIRIVKIDRDKYRYRLIKDGEGVNNRKFICYDERYLLFGSKLEKMGYWTKLSEDKGIEIYLPSTIKEINENKPKVYLKVRNYTDFNEDGTLRFIDSRLKEFL